MKLCTMSFFCTICKSNDDFVSAGCGGRIQRNCSCFKSRAHHTDFMFSTDKLIDICTPTSSGQVKIVMPGADSSDDHASFSDNDEQRGGMIWMMNGMISSTTLVHW